MASRKNFEHLDKLQMSEIDIFLLINIFLVIISIGINLK